MKFISLSEEQDFLRERALTLTGLLYRKFGQQILGEASFNKCMNISERTTTYEYEAKIKGGGYIWNVTDLDALTSPIGFKFTNVGARNDVLELYFKDIKYGPVEQKKQKRGKR